MLDQTASPSANRRVFRSKVDDLRPTYGFEDVSLAPGTDTIEPADVELGQTFCGIDLAIPILAAGDGRGRRSARSPARWRASAASRSSTSKASRRATTTRPRSSPGSPRRPTTRSRTLLADGVRGADPRGPDRAPDRGDPRRRLEGRGRGDARRRAPVRAVLRRARRGPLPRPVPGLAAPATSRPATTRSRSRTSRGSCRSRSRSATRRTARPRSR